MVISTLCGAFFLVKGHSVTISHVIITFSIFNTVFYVVADNIP